MGAGVKESIARRMLRVVAIALLGVASAAALTGIAGAIVFADLSKP